MPTSIPYDPSLVLGNILEKEKLDVLEKVSALQTPIDAAQEALNSDTLLKRSLDMTMQEMVNMGIDPSDVKKEVTKVQKQIKEDAKKYANVSIENNKKIRDLKSKIRLVNGSIESPIDYNRSMIKKMPLSADSLKMDSQYFSFDENRQSANSTMASMKGFISKAAGFLGNSEEHDFTASAMSQIASQRENHELEGTLIITASATHKDAVLLAPFILDVDKGIRAWNSYYPNNLINVNSPQSMQQILKEEGTKNEAKMYILSGATYGSSFVGMVHILKNSSTISNQNMLSIASSIQEKLTLGNAIAYYNDGYGLDSSFSSDVKSLLSNQQISSHITLTTMGSIPKITGNNVQLGVKQFAAFDPKAMTDQLAALQNATASEGDTVNTQAQAARTGARMVSMRHSQIKSVMSALGELDDKTNKILDINSLMLSFEDYVEKALSGNIGVPINYYLKPITRAQLAQMWVKKYYPGKFLEISGDDSGTAGK